MRPSNPADFWARVTKGPGCWLWTGHKLRRGYGALVFRGERIKAHRLAYRLVNGSIPDGAMILHTCNNPSCVNPAHLVAGDHAANMAQRMRDGRVARGEQNRGGGKLTAGKVRRIRKLAPVLKQGRLGALFGISRSMAGQIVRREIWRHV